MSLLMIECSDSFIDPAEEEECRGRVRSGKVLSTELEQGNMSSSFFLYSSDKEPQNKKPEDLYLNPQKKRPKNEGTQAKNTLCEEHEQEGLSP